MANPLWIENLKSNAGAIAGGAVALAGNYAGMNQGLGLNPNPEQMRSDSTMRPTYNLGSAWNQASSASPQGATGGEIFAGVGQGATIGSQILPGVGTAIGGLVGGIGSAIAGGARRRRQRDEKERAMRKLVSAQGQYNQADVSFRNQQNLMEDYRQNQDDSGRLYNYYKSQY